jgi:cell division septum initiation protein DivIVA
MSKRDELAEAYERAAFELNPNGFHIAPWLNAGTLKEAFRDGYSARDQEVEELRAALARIDMINEVASLDEFKQFQNALNWLNQQNCDEAEWLILLLRRLESKANGENTQSAKLSECLVPGCPDVGVCTLHERINDLQTKIRTLEAKCAELERELEVARSVHVKIIDHTPIVKERDSLEAKCDRLVQEIDLILNQTNENGSKVFYQYWQDAVKERDEYVAEAERFQHKCIDLDQANGMLKAEVERLKLHIPTMSKDEAEYRAHKWQESAHAERENVLKLWEENARLRDALELIANSGFCPYGHDEDARDALAKGGEGE